MMLAEKTVYFLRHGETNHNVNNNDEPDTLLTDLGVQQVSSWRQAFGSKDYQDLEVVLVSPLRRAIQTACYAFEDADVPMCFCKHARELWWHQAQCRGVPLEELAEFVCELPRGDEIKDFEMLEEGDEWWDPENEAVEDDNRALEQRARQSIQKLLHVLGERSETKIAVVCHWGVINQLAGVSVDNAELVSCVLKSEVRSAPKRKGGSRVQRNLEVLACTESPFSEEN